MATFAFLSVSDEFCLGTIDAGETLTSAGVSFSNDGTVTVAMGGVDGELRVWDCRTPAEVAVVPWNRVQGFHVPKPAPSQQQCVAVSPDGRAVAVCDRLMARLWIRGEQQPRNLTVPTFGNKGPFKSIAFSPDEGKYIVACRERGVLMWDGKTGLSIGELDGSNDCHVLCAAFSPDGKLLAIGREHDQVRVFDCAARSEHIGRRSELAHFSSAHAVAFSPDGRTLVTGSPDGSVRIAIVAEGGAVKHVLRGHADVVRSLEFSPDGATLATGSDDGTARLWDVQTGICRTTLVHGAHVLSLAFCASGNALATKSYVPGGDPARVWDIGTGKCVASLEGPPVAVHSTPDIQKPFALVFASPDGSMLAVAHARSVRLWDAVGLWATKMAAGRTLTTTAKGVDVVETVVHVARRTGMTGREKGVTSIASVSH